MPYAAVALLEPPVTHTDDLRWTLQRDATDQWCSLVCASTGWTLSIHGAGFTVVAEGAYRSGEDAATVAAVRSRLHALGWNDVPAVRLRQKPDRRRS